MTRPSLIHRAARALLVPAFLLAILGQARTPRGGHGVGIPIPPPDVGDLASKPRAGQGNWQLLGGFRVGGGTSTTYEAGKALAYNAATDSLYITGGFETKDGGGNTYIQMRVYEVDTPNEVYDSNPLNMPLANVLQSTANDVAEGTQLELMNGDLSEWRLGGLIIRNGRLCFTGYDLYDGDLSDNVTHGCHSLNLATSSFVGWDTFWDNSKQGYMSGGMATIPDYAQAALGGPVIAGGLIGSIMARLSWGPSGIVINPDDISGRTPNTHTGYPLIYYDTEARSVNPEVSDTQTCGVNDGDTTWNRSSAVAGMVIPKNSRSLLYFMAHGIGDRCYGQGTATEALHNTTFLFGGSPVCYCYDPMSTSQGEHAYPYVYQVLAYDLLDLALVKAGKLSPWLVKPYDRWTLTFPVTAQGNVTRLGAPTYDYANDRLYIAELYGDPAVNRNHPVIWVAKFNMP